MIGQRGPAPSTSLRAAEVLLTVREAKVQRPKNEVEVQRQEAAENL